MSLRETVANLEAAVAEYDKYTEIVAAAEIWRHWWLLTREQELAECLRHQVAERLSLFRAAEVALEHEVAKLTLINVERGAE